MTVQIINPESLGAPKGYSNGVLAPAGGRILFIAGQIAWNQEHRIVCRNFTGQFKQTLTNVLDVVRAAGGTAEDLTRLTLYVTSLYSYQVSLSEVGTAYRELMGRHYPAMVLVEVKGLLEPGALVEIEGVAVLP